MTYTVKDLKSAIDKGWTDPDYPDYEPSGWDGLSESLFECNEGDTVTLDGIGTLVGIEDHGGGEGDGEARWIIFKVTDAEGGERVFRKNGSYYSHYGTEWDGRLEEVHPVDKLVTVWETK
jgi:hypothetical protein